MALNEVKLLSLFFLLPLGLQIFIFSHVNVVSEEEPSCPERAH